MIDDITKWEIMSDSVSEFTGSPISFLEYCVLQDMKNTTGKKPLHLIANTDFVDSYWQDILS